jgi:glutathione S-transferase
MVAEGTVGGDAPNAADLQIGASVRQLQAIADLAPVLGARPAVALARHFPPMTGGIPAGVAPAEWLP